MKKKLPKDVLEWFREQGRLGAKRRMEKVSAKRRSDSARIAGLAGGRGRPKRKASAPKAA